MTRLHMIANAIRHAFGPIKKWGGRVFQSLKHQAQILLASVRYRASCLIRSVARICRGLRAQLLKKFDNEPRIWRWLLLLAVFSIYGAMLFGILTDGTAIPKNFAELANWFVIAAVPTAFYIAIYRYSIQEQSLLNERYQRAVERFYGENQLTRKAGQIELQILAEKYRAELHTTIMLQFCAFVRHSSNANGDITTDERIAGDSFDEVQAVMLAIGTRSKATLRYEKRRCLCWNLRNSNLAELDLSNLTLANLDLADASLANTVLSNACIPKTVQGLTKKQLEQAVCLPDSPPRIEKVVDAETGKKLVWNR